jgi:hypothetical protein
MNTERIISRTIRTKLEPIIENGKAITIRNVSSQLYEPILKFVAGIGYYANRRKCLEDIENVATANGISLYTTGLLIKQAARLAQVSERTVYRMLPEKFKAPLAQETGKKGAEASNIEQSTSQSVPTVTGIEDNKVIEDNTMEDTDIPTEYTIQDADTVSEEKQSQLPTTQFLEVDSKQWNHIIKKFVYSQANWYIEHDGKK